MTSVSSNDAKSYLVTLRINKGAASLLNRRLIALHPGESVTLGRTSKNPKTEFMAKTTNGYFNNPIVSRSHAILQNRSTGIFIVDQASTHGTYVNGEKLVPFEGKQVENGDCIALGTVLEYTSREHLPTELEIGIVEMDVPMDPDEWVTNERPGTTTNSFHPPDSDSEAEEEEEEEEEEPTVSMTWKPFVNVIPHLPPPPPASQPPIGVDRITLPSILHLPGIQMTAVGVPEQSSTPLNSDAILHHLNPIIDLTDGSSWAAPETVHMESIEISSDRDAEYDEDSEEENDNKQQSGYPFGYEYDAGDKQAMNGVTQIPETQVFVRMEENPINDNMNTVGVEATNARPVDSWNWAKDYFQISGVDEPINDEGSEIDQDVSSDEDYEMNQSDVEEEEVEEEEEEEEEEERFEEEDASIEEDEEISDPEMPGSEPLIVELSPPPLPPVYINLTTTIAVEEEAAGTTVPVESVTQTQSPPITPEQPSISSSRKRPLPTDEDESPTVVPLPQEFTPTRHGTPDSPTQPPAIETKIDTSSDQLITSLVEESASPTQQSEDLERTIKRRRTDETASWSDVMKTMGKYTVAGLIGGAVTFAGLAWSAGS